MGVPTRYVKWNQFGKDKGSLPLDLRAAILRVYNNLCE